MYRQFLMVALTLSSVALPIVPAAAQVAMRSAETAIESSTEIVSLPDSVPTDLGFTPCATCGFVTLRLDESSRFYVGEQQVSLADLHRSVNRGPAGLDVFFSEDTRIVTRIILRTDFESDPAAPAKAPTNQQKKLRGRTQ